MQRCGCSSREFGQIVSITWHPYECWDSEFPSIQFHCSQITNDIYFSSQRLVSVYVSCFEVILVSL